MIRVSIPRTPRDAVIPVGEFEVDIDTRRTILDLLGVIAERHDSTLVYRHSCHHGSCGTCAVRVNGTEVLACATTIESVGSEDLRIEPIRGYAVIADLAVDPGSRYREMPEGIPTTRNVEDSYRGEPPEDVARYTRFETCIECGLCVSACPERGHFVGPFILAALKAALDRSPEAARSDRFYEIAGGERGVAGCREEFACSRVCPTRVYPSRKIIDLRGMLKTHSSKHSGR